MSDSGLIASAHSQIVSVADMIVLREHEGILCTNPLGVGLGVAIFDPVARVAGLWHLLLPASALDQARAAIHPGMFADSGLEAFLQKAASLQADPARLVVCVAGGARLMDEGVIFDIGRRNLEALDSQLSSRGLSVHAAEVGGLANRSMRIDMATGVVRLKISGQPREKQLCRP
jgi:chemotaxis protein CheD